MALGWALHHLGRLEEAAEVLGAAAVRGHRRGREPRPITPTRSTGSASSASRWEATRPRSRCSTRRCAWRAAADRTSDALRVRILNTRAKIRRRQKDFTAAAEDVQQALELARALDDDRVLAETYLDASLVAERRNEYTRAREYAERSKALFERVSDHEYVGKLLNNLGQLHAITGKPDEAVPLLRESFRIAVEQDNRIDAGLRGLVAGLGAPALGRSRRGDRKWKSRNRAIGRSRGIPTRRRERSARHGQGPSGAGSHRRGGAGL